LVIALRYQKEVKEANQHRIMQALASPRSFTELFETVQTVIGSRSALSNHLRELKEQGLVERKIVDDKLVYALTEKGRSTIERPELYGGLSRKYFDEEIRNFVDKSDKEFLKAYVDKLGVLVLYALIHDLESGGGWAEVALPVVKDRLWMEHHIFAKAKVGSYGPKAGEMREVGRPFTEIREKPSKFKKQTDELKAALKILFPEEASRLQRIWMSQS